MAADPHPLAGETSPYLRQFATNPIHWLPWNEAVFKAARQRDLPVMLSIGYSTSHWSHVLNRESYSNPDIGDYINTHFVPVKIDRDEHPGLVAYFRAFLESTEGRTGWPMHVWLTPEGLPYAGAFYMPPSEEWGRPGILNVLEQHVTAWQRSPETVRLRADRAFSTFQSFLAPFPLPAELDSDLLDNARATLRAAFDTDHGGFTDASGRLHPERLRLLLAAGATDADRAHVRLTLDRILHSGLLDPLDGGLFRFSVDEDWQLPYFVKTLADQARGGELLLDAYQVFQDDAYATAFRRLAGFVADQLGCRTGGHHTALDGENRWASSPDQPAEGLHYLWTTEEIDRLLTGPDAAVARAYFRLAEDGNLPSDHLAGDHLEGRNLLRPHPDLAGLAATLDLAPDRLAAAVERIRPALLHDRTTRQGLRRDPTVLTAANAAWLAVLARAARELDADTFLPPARELAHHLTQRHFDPATGELARLARSGIPSGQGGLHDFAALIHALIRLHDATGEDRWIVISKQLQELQDTQYHDPDHGGWFSARPDRPGARLRVKAFHEEAGPSAQALAAANLLQFERIQPDPDRAARARRALLLIQSEIEPRPEEHPHALLVLQAARPR